MNQLKVFYVFATIILLSGMMCSCERIIYGDEDDNGNGSSPSGGSNNLKTGQIEIKVTPNSVNKVSFLAIAKRITIDWGDGSIDELTPNGVSRIFTHEYPNQNLQNIKVNTEGMTEFSRLYDSGIIIRELRFGNCLQLKSIKCHNDQLTVLDVSKCTALTELQCYGNKLTSLDVSKCTALTELYCSSNQLTSLDVSKCTALTKLDCRGNQLTSLDVSKCTALTELYCSSNQLSASALNALFNSLPIRKQDDNAEIVYWYNLGSATCDKTIAEKKGWRTIPL